MNNQSVLVGIGIFILAVLLVWFIGWLTFDRYGNQNSKVSFIFKWYDAWIGFFWDSKKKYLYIFLIPFFGIVIKPFRKNYD